MDSLFGLSHNTTLLVWTLLVIVFLVMLIAKYKWNPFVTLLISAMFLGLVAGMEYPKLIKSITGGLGGTLGTIAIVIGLGTMLGKMMAESGGAERIANTLVDRFGEKRVHWAMMLVGFVVGIPVFFEVGVILLIPVVFMVARKTKMPLLQIGIGGTARPVAVLDRLGHHMGLSPAPLLAAQARGPSRWSGLR